MSPVLKPRGQPAVAGGDAKEEVGPGQVGPGGGGPGEGRIPDYSPGWTPGTGGRVVRAATTSMAFPSMPRGMYMMNSTSIRP